jgi:hypothetical protein
MKTRILSLCGALALCLAAASGAASRAACPATYCIEAYRDCKAGCPCANFFCNPATCTSDCSCPIICLD